MTKYLNPFYSLTYLKLHYYYWISGLAIGSIAIMLITSFVIVLSLLSNSIHMPIWIYGINLLSTLLSYTPNYLHWVATKYQR